MFFFIIALAAGGAAALSFALMALFILYTAPFYLWVGVQHNKGKYRELGNGGCFQSVRNATSLYLSWISHKAPAF